MINKPTVTVISQFTCLVIILYTLNLYSFNYTPNKTETKKKKEEQQEMCKSSLQAHSSTESKEVWVGSAVFSVRSF